MTRDDLRYLGLCKGAVLHVFPHFSTDQVPFVAYGASNKERDPSRVIFKTEEGERDFPLDAVNSVKILSGEDALFIINSAQERVERLKEIIANIKRRH